MSNQIKFTQGGVQRVTSLAPSSSQSKSPSTAAPTIVTPSASQPTFVLTGPLPQVRNAAGRGGISVSTGNPAGLQAQQKSFLIAASSGSVGGSTVIPIQSGNQTVIHTLNPGQAGGNSAIAGLQVVDASPVQLPLVVSGSGSVQPQIVVSSAMQSQSLASRHHGAKLSVSLTH